jgi:hypothetical protein
MFLYETSDVFSQSVLFIKQLFLAISFLFGSNQVYVLSHIFSMFNNNNHTPGVRRNLFTSSTSARRGTRPRTSFRDTLRDRANLTHDSQISSLQKQMSDLTALVTSVLQRRPGSLPEMPAPSTREHPLPSGPTAPSQPPGKLHFGTPYLPPTSHSLKTQSDIQSRITNPDHVAKKELDDIREIRLQYLKSLPKLSKNKGTPVSGTSRPADTSNFYIWNTQLSRYMTLIHKEIAPAFDKIAAVDFTKKWHRNQQQQTSLVPLPTIPDTSVAKAQAALLGSIGEEYQYLVANCGPMDLFDAYAKIVIHFAPNNAVTQGESMGRFWNLGIQDNQNIKQFANTLLQMANNINLAHGSSYIDNNHLLSALKNGLTEPLCSPEQALVYRDALKSIQFYSLDFPDTIEFISTNSTEAPTVPHFAAAVRTRGGGRGRGRGNGRGNGRGDRGGRAPPPAGHVEWNTTMLVGADSNGDTLVGKGRPIKHQKSGLCTSQLIYGTCQRQDCPFDHEFNILRTNRAARAPAIANAPVLASPAAISTANLQTALSNFASMDMQKQTAVNSAAAKSSAATAKFPAQILSDQKATSAVSSESAAAALADADALANAQLDADAAAFALPTSADYAPRNNCTISGPDQGFQQVGSMATCPPDVFFSMDDASSASGCGAGNLTQFSCKTELEPPSKGSFFPFLYIFISFILLYSELFITLSFRSLSTLLSYAKPPILLLSNLLLTFLRILLSTCQWICDRNIVLYFFMLPLLFSLTFTNVSCTFIKILFNFRPSGFRPLRCRRTPRPSRQMAMMAATKACQRPIRPRKLPVLEDSGCTGIMSGDMDQSIGPKRICDASVQVANKAYVKSSHVAKISLNGHLVDCLFVPGFHQTLVSKAKLFLMGYTPITSSSGRTDYVDSKGNIFISFQLQSDNLFHLIENNQPTISTIIPKSFSA